MTRIAIVGCTGKLGSDILKNALVRKDVEVSHAIARKGNRFAGHGIAELVGGTMFGEHEVIFANCKDEVVTFRHRVSSRETFADGAVEVALWTAGQPNGLYGMDDFCAGSVPAS